MEIHRSDHWRDAEGGRERRGGGRRGRENYSFRYFATHTAYIPLSFIPFCLTVSPEHSRDRRTAYFQLALGDRKLGGITGMDISNGLGVAPGRWATMGMMASKWHSLIIFICLCPSGWTLSLSSPWLLFFVVSLSSSPSEGKRNARFTVHPTPSLSLSAIVAPLLSLSSNFL